MNVGQAVQTDNMPNGLLQLDLALLGRESVFRLFSASDFGKSIKLFRY